MQCTAVKPSVCRGLDCRDVGWFSTAPGCCCLVPSLFPLVAQGPLTPHFGVAYSLPPGFPWDRTIVIELLGYGLGCEEVAQRRGGFPWSPYGSAAFDLEMTSCHLLSPLCISVWACYCTPCSRAWGEWCSPRIFLSTSASTSHLCSWGDGRMEGEAVKIHTRQHLCCCKGWQNWRGEPVSQQWFDDVLQGGSHLFTFLAFGLS